MIMVKYQEIYSVVYDSTNHCMFQISIYHILFKFELLINYVIGNFF